MNKEVFEKHLVVKLHGPCMCFNPLCRVVCFTDSGVSVGSDEPKCGASHLYDDHSAHGSIPQRHGAPQLCSVSGNRHTIGSAFILLCSAFHTRLVSHSLQSLMAYSSHRDVQSRLA